MKKIMMSAGLLVLFTAPVFASPYCMDNSDHLTTSYDDKEWHSVECACDCTTIKGGHCADCGHLQDARPLTVIESSFAPLSPRLQSAGKATADTTTSQNKAIIRTPDNPQDALKKLAAQYVKNRYDI